MTRLPAAAAPALSGKGKFPGRTGEYGWCMTVFPSRVTSYPHPPAVLYTSSPYPCSPQHGHREHAHAHSRRIIRRDMVCAQEVRIGTPVALRLLPALREDQAEEPVQIALPYRNQLLVYLYPPVLYLGYLVQGYYERAVYPDEILRE